MQTEGMHVPRKRHLGRRDWRCDLCGAAAVTRWLAQAHCRPRMRQACPAATCSRSFTTAANLATHLRTHTGERPHVCSVCSKSFISKDTLRNHFRTHTGVKPYLCAECGAQFATNKLAEHQRAHTRAQARASCVSPSRANSASPRIYACAWCAMSYAHKQSLNKHVRNKHRKKVRASLESDAKPIDV